MSEVEALHLGVSNHTVVAQLAKETAKVELEWRKAFMLWPLIPDRSILG